MNHSIIRINQILILSMPRFILSFRSVLESQQSSLLMLNFFQDIIISVLTGSLGFSMQLLQLRVHPCVGSIWNCSDNNPAALLCF